MAAELDMALPDGLRLRGLQWSPPPSCRTPRRLLAVHGRLDNAGSFSGLAPLIAAKAGAHVVALDLPGHGRSDWFEDGFYASSRVVMVLRHALEVLKWWDDAGISVLAHSHGTVYATLLLAAFPEKFGPAIFLDGFGGFGMHYGIIRGTEVNHTEPSRGLRLCLESVVALNKRQAAQTPRVYAGVKAAAEARVKAADHMSPRPKRMQFTSAKALVDRGTRPVTMGASLNNRQRESASEGVVFTHDTRVDAGIGLQLYHVDDMLELHSRLPPLMILCADQGYPKIIENANNLHARLLPEAQRNITIHIFASASHHFHLDDPDRVVDHIVSFMADSTNRPARALPVPSRL